MRKAIICLGLIAVLMLGGCASFERAGKSLDSELQGGLPRVIKVYNADGTLMAEYKGRIDIRTAEGGSEVLFEYKGKRYAYYNCFVEAVEVEE